MKKLGAQHVSNLKQFALKGSKHKKHSNLSETFALFGCSHSFLKKMNDSPTLW